MSQPGHRPAVFLDRDGVLNVDTGYAHKPEDLALTPTAGQAVRLLNEAGYLAIVISNQSGVARGMFTCADVDRFHDRMQDALAVFGARIDAFYYCPYHPAGSVPAFAKDHADRKPGPGMLLRAMADWAVAPSRATMIGDRGSDMAAAEAAGIRGILVERDVCDLARIVRGVIG